MKVSDDALPPDLSDQKIRQHGQLSTMAALLALPDSG